MLVVLACGMGGVGVGQPPKKEPPFPPLNLAVAKLAQTATLSGPGVALALDEGRKRLLVGCEDGTLHVWAQAEGKDLLAADAKPQVHKAHAASVTAVAAGGPTLASADVGGKVLIWGPPGDKPSHTIKAPAAVRALAVSPDGKVLAGAGDDGAVQLWTAPDGKPLRKLTGPTDWVLALAFSADGKQLAAGGQDGRLWVWDAGTGGKRFDVLAQAPPAPKVTPAVNVVSAIAFSPDGKQIALGGSDTRVYLFGADGKFQRQVQPPGHAGAVTALAYHPGGAALASASADRTVKFWNPQTGQLLRSLDGHTAWVRGLAFFDKGTRLLTTGADRTVREWALTNPPPPVKKK
jgi:WD40 repeat protein